MNRDTQPLRRMTDKERESLQGENGTISEDYEAQEQASDSSHIITVVRTRRKQFTNGYLVEETDEYRMPDPELDRYLYGW